MRTHVSLLLSIVLCTMVFRNQAQPVAVTDYCTLPANEETVVNVKANDVYDPTHNISILPLMTGSFQGTFGTAGSGFIRIYPSLNASGTDTVFYTLADLTLSQQDTGLIVVTFLPLRNAAFLDINGVKALVNSNGSLFWDLQDQNYYEVPLGSGSNTIFTTSLMASGKDANDSTYLLFQDYGSNQNVFAGPLDTTDGQNDSLNYHQRNRVWKLTAAEITDFRNHWWEAGYVIPEAIMNWPAHGNSSVGESFNIAPFYDAYDDQDYDPYTGDYPLIKGDQAIVFLINNPLNAPSTDYNPMGLQILGMVYAYECSSDTLFNTSVFIDYTVANYSQIEYRDAMLGMFADFDIGYAYDDYIGSFVDVQTMYAYNADTLDENGNGAIGYGDYPPAQGITLLKGPLADLNDGLDNDFDNTIDEPDETCGMYASVQASYTSTFPLPGPVISMYSLMHAYKNDTTPILWPDTTHDYPCRYMFPGTSDPDWLGTGGIPMTPAVWTEYLMNDMPYDRRSLMSFGPFTFEPFARKTITLGLVYAQQDGLPHYQVPDLLHARIETLLDYYDADSIPCGGSFSGTATLPVQSDFQLYPNPAADEVTVDLSQHFLSDKNQIIEIYDLKGQQILRIPCTAAQQSIPVSALGEGVYIVRISSSLGCTAKRLVIVR